MRRKFLPEKVYDERAIMMDRNPASRLPVSIDTNDHDQTYAAAMTEFSICRSTSQMTRYTNPYGDL